MQRAPAQAMDALSDLESSGERRGGARDNQSIASSSEQSLLNGPYSNLEGSTGSSPSQETNFTTVLHAQSSPRAALFRLPSLDPPGSPALESPSVAFRARAGHHHATWAGTFHSRPELLIRPRSIQEVQKAVVFAKQCRRRVAPVGVGHSPSALTCSSAWMVSLEGMDQVLEMKRASEEQTLADSSYEDDPSEGFGLNSSLRSKPEAQPTTDDVNVLVQAGISLEKLNLAVAEHNLTIPNLGSINVQHLAGAIATATHGSSLQHGLLSQNVRGLRIVLADGRAVWCSAQEREDLFRAALVSLGGLGVITEIEIRVVPTADIEWQQQVISLDTALERWATDLWTQAEFVRCWWMPHTARMIVWRADKTTKPRRKAPVPSWVVRFFAGYHSYHALLWLCQYLPALLPTVEWFVFGLLNGFALGSTRTAVEPLHEGLLMDCLFSQYVNEWAIPLRAGPEVLRRLSAWLNRRPGHDIPFDNRKLYVHCPIEVRVTDGSAPATSPRAWLDPTRPDEPSLYLNATLYRPFGLEPPCRARFYEAFEWLMKQYGGRPHWAKNFATVSHLDIRAMYGDDLDRWLEVREHVDPEGMFMGAWHRSLLLGSKRPALPLEEAEVRTVHRGRGQGEAFAGAQREGSDTTQEGGALLKRLLADAST